ncbi:MAG: hypothetical protein KR126chlam1_00285 [Chlamydiae bacterium]|nr:hypothetical protein [Chlamydiota bacterium]
MNTISHYTYSAATFIGNSVKVLDNAANTVASCVSYRSKTYSCLLGALIAFRPSASLNQTVYSAITAADTALVAYTFSSFAKAGFDIGCTRFLPNAKRCTRLASLLLTYNAVIFGPKVMSLTLPRVPTVLVLNSLPLIIFPFIGMCFGGLYRDSLPLEAAHMTQRAALSSLKFSAVLTEAIFFIGSTVDAISNRPKTYTSLAAAASATLYCFMPKAALTITKLGLWGFTSTWCADRILRSYARLNSPPSRVFFKNLSLGLIASNIFSALSSTSLRNIMIGNSVVAVAGVVGRITGQSFRSVLVGLISDRFRSHSMLLQERPVTRERRRQHLNIPR